MVVWLGGLVAAGVVNARLTRELEPAQPVPLTRAIQLFGSAVIALAGAITLIAGRGHSR